MQTSCSLLSRQACDRLGDAARTRPSDHTHHELSVGVRGIDRVHRRHSPCKARAHSAPGKDSSAGIDQPTGISPFRADRTLIPRAKQATRHKIVRTLTWILHKTLVCERVQSNILTLCHEEPVWRGRKPSRSQSTAIHHDTRRRRLRVLGKEENFNMVCSMIKKGVLGRRWVLGRCSWCSVPRHRAT